MIDLVMAAIVATAFLGQPAEDEVIVQDLSPRQEDSVQPATASGPKASPSPAANADQDAQPSRDASQRAESSPPRPEKTSKSDQPRESSLKRGRRVAAFWFIVPER